MPYWQLYYRLVWSTKYREPLVTPEVEALIYGFLRRKAIGLGATVFALNGMPNHVHLVAAIPPKIAVAKFVGQVKAVASTKFNKSGVRDLPLFWQEEYGAFSFDLRRLPFVVAYVERQKEHHRQRRMISALERADDTETVAVRDAPAAYPAGETEWRRDMEAIG